MTNIKLIRQSETALNNETLDRYPVVTTITKVSDTACRYVFADALRGIAALAVLLHHLLHNSVLEVTLRRILPMPIQILSHYGANGVQIFFVLSGFVIAHSVRNLSLSPKEIGNFIMRRQLRLDPPYWTILCLTLLTLKMESLAFHHAPQFGIGSILANYFYLQKIVHTPSVVDVAWTLCIEIQFYLAFIFLLALGQYKINYTMAQKLTGFSVTLVFILGTLSLLSTWQSINSPWFITYWFYFTSGVLGYWAVKQYLRQVVFLVFVGLFWIGAFIHSNPGMIVGAATATTLYLVGRHNHLTDWLGHRILQYFGRISYSLYLIHLLVAVEIMKFGYKITGENLFAALGWFILAGLASIGASHLLFTFIEKPSMQFASNMKKVSKSAS